MNKSNATNYPPALLVLAGRDRFGEHRGLGIRSINFKVTPQDHDGILVIENTFQAKGGPARHLHFKQDEWFYITAGEFLFEVGEETYRLNPGDAPAGAASSPSRLGLHRRGKRRCSHCVFTSRESGVILS